MGVKTSVSFQSVISYIFEKMSIAIINRLPRRYISITTHQVI
jgi:hypothetical protein